MKVALDGKPLAFFNLKNVREIKLDLCLNWKSLATFLSYIEILHWNLQSLRLVSFILAEDFSNQQISRFKLDKMLNVIAACICLFTELQRDIIRESIQKFANHQVQCATKLVLHLCSYEKLREFSNYKQSDFFMHRTVYRSFMLINRKAKFKCGVKFTLLRTDVGTAKNP